MEVTVAMVMVHDGRYVAIIRIMAMSVMMSFINNNHKYSDCGSDR